MAKSSKNIWGKSVATVSISAVVAAYINSGAVEVESAIDAIIEPAVSGEAFSADEVLGANQAAVVEYTEKHFEGPAMSDDEWASL